MEKIIIKYSHLLAAFALAVSAFSAMFCYFIFHQPKIPDSVMELRSKKIKYF